MGRRCVAATLVIAGLSLVGCAGGNGDGCDDGGSCAGDDVVASGPPTTELIAEDDLAAMMAVAVPAAVTADPDKGGDVNAQPYRIGDAFGVNGDDGVVFGTDVAASPISAKVQAAISSSLSPGWAQFVTAHPARGMLRIAMPERHGADWEVEFEFFCGGDPAALCGSGVTLRMQKVNGNWTVVDVESGWIS